MARWTVPLLGIGLLTFSLTAAPNLDSDMLAPAARAAIPDSDLLMRQRKATIAEATRALNEAQVELEAAFSPDILGDGTSQTFNAERWRGKVDTIKERYHIWGTVDRQHPDSRSENALHSALYLLYSMEHAFALAQRTENWASIPSLRTKFLSHLDQANQG